MPANALPVVIRKGVAVVFDGRAVEAGRV